MKTAASAPGDERPHRTRRKRAVPYARVSTSAQVENGSLSKQISACQKWSNKNGVSTTKPFQDCASGRTLENRPGLMAAIEEIVSDKAHYLLVASMDRLTRSATDLGRINQMLKRTGAEVRSATEAVDESPEGQRLAAALVRLAQAENEARAALRLDALKLNARMGRHVGLAPRGYLRTCRVQGPVSMEIDKPLKPGIRWAFEAAANGVPQVEILGVLNSMPAFKSPIGKPLTKQALSRMLNNPVYCGRLIIPNWEIDSRGDWEEIISRELFDRVQKVMAGRGPKTGANAKPACNANISIEV